MLSSKNKALSAASADLGLGDQLQQETEAQILERKKKLLSQQQQQASPLGPATQALFPNAFSV